MMTKEKKLFKSFLTGFICVACLSACSIRLADDDDLVVYVGDQTQDVAELTERDYQIIQDQREYMAKYYDFDFSTYDKNPDVKRSAFYPDTFIALTDGSGYVGYVDLGLPSGTKWAVMNVGAVPINRNLPAFNQYFTRPHLEEPDLERFTIADSLKDVIPYSDYVKLGRGKDPEAQMNSVWDEYLKACQQYVKAFEKARDEYCTMVEEAHFSCLYCPQHYVLYGSNILMKKGETLKSPMPDRLSGPSNDAATNLWGSHWATPTLEQIKELLTSSKQTGVSVTYGYVDSNDKHYGTIVTGRTGKKLFLPWAAGCSPENDDFTGSVWPSDGSGYYMISERSTDYDEAAIFAHVSRKLIEFKVYRATSGVSLRPVYRE